MKITHPHGQVENATAPLRLCARLSGWECGMRLTFSGYPRTAFPTDEGMFAGGQAHM
ncbi:MAG: hypothetical protein PHF14_07745 [Verrucomicrobiota bacterium]|jgi:hypothetical protein|nr:hypothetical protein [Verrucomicrobiota bacterium]MDD8046339.1 hypothetical protein [Verrucomicrobiota bacterium]MDD8051113.1 hypothetical protein [Verrucomicrobiota bacterium]